MVRVPVIHRTQDYEREGRAMVNLLVGHKGSGKTKQMIDIANERAQDAAGSLIFINKNQRLMYDLKHTIRVVCMEDYPAITNADEYIGFIYGIISSDHDIEEMFIDSILKHADISIKDLPVFIDRLKKISELHDLAFTVSLSAEKEELTGVDFSGCNIINQ